MNINTYLENPLLLYLISNNYYGMKMWNTSFQQQFRDAEDQLEKISISINFNIFYYWGIVYITLIICPST